MPFFTYILLSEQSDKRYFGSTECLDTRLAQHNAGRVKSSKPFRPYRVLYFEVFDSRSEAYRRELFFKSVDGYRYLKSHNII